MIVNLTLETGRTAKVDLQPLIDFLNRNSMEDPEVVTEEFMAIMQVVHDVMRKTHPSHAENLLKTSLALLQGVEIVA